MRAGTLLTAALRGERITEQSVRQAVRSAGIGGLEFLAAVGLETDGELNVISTGQAGRRSALADMIGGDGSGAALLAAEPADL